MFKLDKCVARCLWIPHFYHLIVPRCVHSNYILTYEEGIHSDI